MSSGQERLWLLDQVIAERSAYHVELVLEIEGILDIGALSQAWQDVALRHEGLRSTFLRTGDGLKQQIHPGALEPLILLQTALTPEQRAGVARRPFDLERDAPIRVSLYTNGERHALVVVAHHAAVDAWSLGLLLQDLFGLYEERRKGATPRWTPPPVQPADLAVWQRAQVNTPAWVAQRQWWRDELAQLPALDLPADRLRPTVQSHRGGLVPVELDPALTAQIEVLGALHGCTLFMTLMAAFQALLFRLSGATDFGVGTATAGRPHVELHQTLGFLVNTVVIRADLSGDPTFEQLLVRVRERCTAALSRQDLPYDQVVDALRPARDPSRNPLFQVCLLLENAPVPELELPGLRIRPSISTPDGAVMGTSKFDLSLCLVKAEGALRGCLEFDADLFDPATIQTMARRLTRLVEAAAAAPSTPVTRLELLSPEERRRVLVEWNSTEAPLDEPLVLHRRFAQLVERSPDGVALRDGLRSVTRMELERRANRLAHHLLRLSPHPEPLFGLCMDSSTELVVAILAVLKAGGAYVPLDPSYPDDRLRYMAEDAGLRFVLTSRELAGRAPRSTTPLVLEELEPSLLHLSEHPPVVEVGSDGAAYVVYTSGSTGRPKGVVGLHGATSNRLQWMWKTFPFATETVCCQKTSITFVDSVWEIFGPLLAGVPLVMVPAKVRKDLPAFVHLLSRERVTWLVLVPSLLRALLELVPPVEQRLSALDMWISSGEALPEELVQTFRGRFPKARLLNLYGSSEVAGDVTAAVASELEAGEVVPLGRPLSNTWIYLLDETQGLVPPGACGEIWVGGANLARGYLGKPALTAERFLPDPFRPGQRMYRTGDLGRWRGDGQLQFLGRVDQQVKIRGIRVELEEVSAALRQLEGVRDAITLLRTLPSGPALLSWVICTSNQDGEEVRLRECLAQRLPEAMVPARIGIVERWPLTPNGKIDRTALPTPERQRSLSPSKAPQPLSTMESTIARCWAEVLGGEDFSLDESFFEAGGDSLGAARLHSKLSVALDLPELRLVQIFENPTVRGLARALSRPAAPPPRGQRRAPPKPGPDSIAVIGLSGRFPMAPDPSALWERLKSGHDCVTRFSPEELRDAGVSERELRDPRYVRARPMLEGIDRFDAGFFGFSPRDAALLDPQHRLFLECAWEAFEAAGRVPSGSRTGVYAGAGLPTYLLGNAELAGLPMAEVFRTVVGSDKDYLSTRVSYKLDLRGPSMTIQTACSTGLVAVATAVDSLKSGACDLALAGAVSVQVPQLSGYRYEEGMILSPDGRCRPFDAGANGTLFGSGAGVVLLKRLGEAIADGDPILAVIRGAAVNNDGAAKAGYTAPGVEGQSQVIAAAMAAAGVGPDDVSYIEAHGTGTAIGDPIEVEALRRVYRDRDPRSGPLGLGSVKSNVGHLDTAAGMVGLTKAILMLQHEAFVPTLHFERANPLLQLEDGLFEVIREHRPWTEGPRTVGVSAFGIGGTNAHVILSQSPSQERS